MPLSVIIRLSKKKAEVISLKKTLPQCFLGKQVRLDSERSYTIKYQDNSNKDGVHVLLFDDEKPVIFAIMKDEGSFKSSFFVSKQSNQSSIKAMSRYNSMIERRASHKLSQDDLKDALRSKEDAKMKNDNIFKLLVDEHLEDIKNGWPSRLLYMQNVDFKSEQSLIIESLQEALVLANPLKSFYFLTLHRYDKLLSHLGSQLSQNNQLLENIFSHYKQSGRNPYLFAFLKKAAKSIPLENTTTIKSMVSHTYSYDIENSTQYFKPVFLLLYKRIKDDGNINMKAWLNDLTSQSILRQAIQTLRKSS